MGGDSKGSSSDVANPGTVSNGTFYSEALDRTMRYVIYLPPGYDDTNYRFGSYPVVYLLPGSSGGTKSKRGSARRSKEGCRYIG